MYGAGGGAGQTGSRWHAGKVAKLSVFWYLRHTSSATAASTMRVCTRLRMRVGRGNEDTTVTQYQPQQSKVA
jgi:hypothetical protein